MKISATKNGDSVKAKLQDALDITTVSEARDNILQLLNSGGSIRFDLSSMTEIDTAGVQLILAVRKEASAMGKECRFVHPSPPIEDVFRALGRSGIFDESVLTAQAKG
ncbi:MAG: STAS domain-containing protein [Fibrobacterota bacterium]